MDSQPGNPIQNDKFDLSFKVFHELMARKVSDILLTLLPTMPLSCRRKGAWPSALSTNTAA